MKMPALRLPAWRPSFDFAEGLGGRRTLLYVVYTGVLFVVFLLANFEYNLITQRLLRSVDIPGVRLAVGDTRFAWWRGFELQRVRAMPLDPEAAPYFEAASLFIRPGLGGLLRGQIDSVQMSGVLYGGEMDGTFTAGEGLNRATLHLAGLQLQRSEYLRDLLQAGELAGVLSGDFTFENRGGDPVDARAVGEFELQNASVTDAKFKQFTVPALQFDETMTKFSLQANRLEIQEFSATGPQFELAGTGQIAIRDPLPDSALNLKVSIAAAEGADDLTKTLLSILPPPPKGAKPDAPRSLSGTLAKPRLS
jgi:type II secretion system protein N